MLAVILADGDARIDGRLAGRHRHGGGVADDHRPVHEGFPGLRVFQLGKFPDRLHDLACPLTAGHDDHDIGLGVAGDDLLQDGFAGPKRSGDAGRPAFGQGEEDVDEPALGEQLPVGQQPLLIGRTGIFTGHSCAIVTVDFPSLSADSSGWRSVS